MAFDPLANATAAEMKRFALCFVYLKDRSTIDWDKAAVAYDPKIKPASFKTVTLKAIAKVAKGDDDEDGSASPVKKASAASGKRKAAAENDDDGAPKVQKRRGRPAKKTKVKAESPEPETEGDEDDE